MLVDGNPDDELMAAYLPAEEPEQQPTGDEVEPEEAEAPEEGELEPTEDEVADKSEDEPEKTRTLKVNGEEITVTESELEAGYMKDADYRQKTARLASDRKEVEADRESYGKGIETLMAQLAVADQLIKGAGLSLTDEQLDALASEDPGEYIKMTRLMARNQEKQMQLHHQWQQAAEAKKAEQAKAIEKHRKTEREALEAEAPEFRKTETWEALYGFLKGEAFGFSQEELDSITDRRFAKIADMARKYAALKTKGAEREKKLVAANKVLKPGAARPIQQDEEQQEFQRGLAKVKGGDKRALGDLIASHL